MCARESTLVRLPCLLSLPLPSSTATTRTRTRTVCNDALQTSLPCFLCLLSPRQTCRDVPFHDFTLGVISCDYILRRRICLAWTIHSFIHSFGRSVVFDLHRSDKRIIYIHSFDPCSIDTVPRTTTTTTINVVHGDPKSLRVRSRGRQYRGSISQSPGSRSSASPASPKQV